MTQMQEHERKVELIDYIDVVVKWKWLIAAVTLMFVVGGLLRSSSQAQPTWYSAKALIYVASSKAASAEGRATEVALPTLSPAFYRSIALADEVRLKMEILRVALQDSMGLDSAPMGMQVGIVEQTGIELEVRSTVPGLPVPLVNAWTDTFMSLSEGLSASELGSMHQAVAAQFDSARNRLEDAEKRLERFDGAGQSGFLDEELAAYRRQIADLQDTVVSSRLLLVTVRAKLARAREIVSALEVDGEGLHTLPAAKRKRLATDSQHPLTRQMLGIMAERDQLIESPPPNVDVQGGKRNEAGVETPSGSASQHSAAEYGKALRSGALQRLPEADSLWAVQRELARHSPTISLKLTVPAQDLLRRMGEADTVSNENINRLTRLARRGLWSKDLDLAFLESEEPNPVYVELKKLEARHGLALAVAEHRLMVGLESDRVSATQDMFVALLDLYQVSRRQVSRLLSEVLALQAEVRDLEKGLLEQQTVIQRLNRLTLEQDRLTRTRETRQITYDRLAKLAEEARIAAQIASANLRIITRAGTPVSEGEFTRQSVPLVGAIGLILSIFFVFVVEYVSKARARQAAGRN